MAKRAVREESDEAAEHARLQVRLGAIVHRLEAEATRRVGERVYIEEEWIKDLQQYHARYDDVTQAELDARTGSKLFVPLTRAQTNAMAARLMDVLFPTDDRNWAIEPTPVPRMMGHNGGPPLNDGASVPVMMAAQGAPVADPKVAAREAADLMQDEIDDQLTECGYQAQCRDVIDDACKVGTGILEGPVANDRVRRGWARPNKKDVNGHDITFAKDGSPIPNGADGKPIHPGGKPQIDENAPYMLTIGGDPRPAFYRISPWAFFPDPDARSIEESEENLVRHLWKAKQLKKFARAQGVMVEAVRDLLREGPRSPAPDYIARVRTLTGIVSDSTRDLFHVWKWTGPLTPEEMRDLAMYAGDAATYADMAEVDPLDDVQAVVWFCQGRVLKFSIYPLDSGETTYSVFCLEKDEESIWGYGVPRMKRDPQKALNAAWRMLMDNAGLSTGDQIIINKRGIRPQDGNWEMTPRKIWEALEEGVDVRTLFATFAIEGHMDQLIPMIELCRQQMQDGMPALGQPGDEGAISKGTAVGTAVLMTQASNIVFTRIVKNWDDDMTAPNLRRLYDWNMQFSPRQEIKGDFDVKPRGASVLLVREMQQQNLMIMLAQFSGHPVLGKYLKDVKAFRELWRALKLDHEEFVANDEEAEAADQAEAEMAAAQLGADGGKPSGKTPEEIELAQNELDAKVTIAEMERDTRLRVAEMQRDTEMMKLAQQGNVRLDELELMMAEKDKDRRSKERTIAAEMAARASSKSPLNETQIANT